MSEYNRYGNGKISRTQHNVALTYIRYRIMSPAQAKQKQHERYDALAVQVARGRAGYKPAAKSRFSKSASNKFDHAVAFA